MKFLALIAMLISTSVMAKTLPPFSLPQMNATPVGTMFDSENNHGRVWLIENYYNACSYCNANAPMVNSLADFYKDNTRILFVDLGIDRTDNLYQSWISKHSPNHPVLKDASRVVTNVLGTQGYPTSYIISCNMEILWSHEGSWDASTVDEIKSKIASALTEVCPLPAFYQE